jgi:hypothetical protein
VFGRIGPDDANATPASTPPAVQSYVSRVIKDEDTIVLRGETPSEADGKILQGVVADTSPSATFIDKSSTNARVPDHDTWLAAMTFALRQLGKLDHGSAVLCDFSITIDGVTKADNDFASFKRRLAEEAPKGIKLQIALKPHEAHPFVWTAQLRPEGVNLAGYVPDGQDQVLNDYAQSAFPNYKINNNMALAAGEPKGWIDAAKVSLDILGLLHSGSVTLSDTVIKVDGTFASPGMTEAIRRYMARLPRGFRVEMNVVEQVTGSAPSRPQDMSFVGGALPASLNP